MSSITRFGVSLDTELLNSFDQHILQKGYKNRSEAIRDLIRENLITGEWKERECETVGVFSIVFDHHQSDLSSKLNSIQHDHLDIIISTTHIHIDHKNCLEVIILKGKTSIIQSVSNALSSIRGVKHGKLIMTTTGLNI